MEVRKLIESDKRTVEVARSKSREVVQRNRAIQDEIWADNQVKKKAEHDYRLRENSKERTQNLNNSKEIERNIKEHSQQRRVDSVYLRYLSSK